ncbi:MAG TPA: O-antigen ligase family protein [Pyrinomonadaceae bacterium]|nr:O-antigen ligase family protein [Pyrinomonadaceae bacterium]
METAADGLTDGDAGAKKVSGATVQPSPAPARAGKGPSWILKRGHALSYAGLFLFTAVLYFRPYELFPALSSFNNMAFVLAVATLLVFFPTQLVLEGTLTARPREVNLLLLLCLVALLSVPLAIDPGVAWDMFSGNFIKAILMFIVMVNVVRTQRRLKTLILLALAVSLFLSAGALNDYSSGKMVVEGYRVAGRIGGLFDNPNDLALHLVTMIPVSIALLLSARGLIGKLGYGVCTALMLAAITVTFSRGGFLGLVAASIFLAWKLGRRNRFGVVIVMLAAGMFFLVLAPGNFPVRVLSIFIPSLDPVGSSGARQQLLIKSVLVALRHPLLGVGMGNFPIVSIHDQVSHNAYTQVASEMGLAALAFYVLFILSPLKRLREIEGQTYEARRATRFYYYFSVGLQASLVGYMVSSFFASVAYLWYVYYLVGYAVCLRRMYEAEHGLLKEPAGVGAQTKAGRARRAAGGRAEVFAEPEAEGGFAAK